jgi:ADP-dependent NAD(P)H-hydrate dehydratase / NAD(P)H-hydrate epimerase
MAGVAHSCGLTRMRRIGTSSTEPLFGVEATRAIEQELASALPPFELMARAGAAVAQLARAVAPHAKRIWIACGPGNNGGDGLVAARLLHLLSRQRSDRGQVVVTLAGDPSSLPPDAARALSEAQAAGVVVSDTPPDDFDLGIDALLGIGARGTPRALLAAQLTHMHAAGCPVLAVDVPSGLMADSGTYSGPAPSVPAAPRHTLSLLTLKPGLFTADGRDLSGTVWFDPLETPAVHKTPQAYLYGQENRLVVPAHAAHKGSQGDVVVIGGQDLGLTGAGMTGAAILAARAALHAGAGRVYLGLLSDDDDSVRWDPGSPEIMLRRVGLLTQSRHLMQDATVVCGCGGGTAVAPVLPALLSIARSLVLDADALNRIAEDAQLQELMRQRRSRSLCTVITPHPLEAARLLKSSTAEVMRDRLGATETLCESLGAICVLKGSGTVVQAPGEKPRINSSGNPALATAGTGDVLAGWIGAALAAGAHHDRPSICSVLSAVFGHGQLADHWVQQNGETLTAHRLAMAIKAR